MPGSRLCCAGLQIGLDGQHGGPEKQTLLWAPTVNSNSVQPHLRWQRLGPHSEGAAMDLWNSVLPQEGSLYTCPSNSQYKGCPRSVPQTCPWPGACLLPGHRLPRGPVGAVVP